MMGTDVTAVIERRATWGWETIGVFTLPRNHDFFDDLREEGDPGYPPDMAQLTGHLLSTLEDWGEGYMDYATFRRLLDKYGMSSYDIMRKKNRAVCRVVFRFDNRSDYICPATL